MRKGILENLYPISLLVLVNFFVGAMVGTERSILPNLASSEFGVASKAAAVSFLISFGSLKAIGNLFAGWAADRFGRKRVLIAGWFTALPVPFIVIFAPSWAWIVGANLLLGINQALCWSVTVIMKIDLAGSDRRGFATALNEWAGYIGVATAALGTGYLATTYSVRPIPFYIGIAAAVLGLCLSLLTKETKYMGEKRRSSTSGDDRQNFRTSFVRASWKQRTLLGANQAGLTTNLKDGVMWGLVPLYLSDQGLSHTNIGTVAAVYPAVWGFCQLLTGPLSDRFGRKWMITSGMAVQSVGISAFVISEEYWQWISSAAVIGAGTALVYPTLLALVSDEVNSNWRASALGVFRLWRDSGYVIAGVGVGYLADILNYQTNFYIVAGLLLFSSGLTAYIVSEPKQK